MRPPSRRENFGVLRERRSRLSVQTLDVRDLHSTFPSGRFDGLCLSNVFELMSEAEAAAILRRIPDVLADEGRMTLRNLMVPRAVPADAPSLVLDEETSDALSARDRSFVYRSFRIYRRLARAAGAR